MADNGAFSEAEQQFLAEQRERAKQKEKRLKKRKVDDGGPVNINSLMDIMVIILVFLLKNYGDEPIKVVGEDLKAPDSSTQLTPEDMTTITISQKVILVNNKKAADVKSGAVDKSQKRGGESGMVIQPLFDELTEAIKRKKREMKLLGQPYEPTATIISDQSTPFRLLTEVMYTAGQAELNQFKFAVVKTDRKSFLPK
jgi:biopolymer transport protein ExbD